MRLDGAVVTLTGATGGIGQPLALALAVSGAHLVLAGRDANALQQLSGRLPPGSVVASCRGDLTLDTARADLIEASRAAGSTVLVNLSGGNHFGLLEQQTDADLSRLLDVNLKAPMALTRGLLPHLKRCPEALVVNVGSAFGLIGFPGYAAYCACKFGLRGFSEALARELSDGPVRVLHVAPRATRTAMNPPAVRAMNQALGNTEDPPERVAQRIVRAILHDERRAALGWRERCFAAVNQLLPAMVDRAVGRQLEVVKRFAAQPEEDKSP